MKKIVLLINFVAFAYIAQAQMGLKSILERCPEMEAGKLYTGKDVRAMAKKNFPKGIFIAGQGIETKYPFAKITGKKVVALLAFEDKYKGEIVYMHAYVFRKKIRPLCIRKAISITTVKPTELLLTKVL